MNRQRLRNLLIRLVASGPKAAHVSASECHEIVDETFEVLTELEKAQARIALLERHVTEWLTEPHTCAIADFVHVSHCAGCAAALRLGHAFRGHAFRERR